MLSVIINPEVYNYSTMRHLLLVIIPVILSCIQTMTRASPILDLAQRRDPENPDNNDMIAANSDSNISETEGLRSHQRLNLKRKLLRQLFRRRYNNKAR